MNTFEKSFLFLKKIFLCVTKILYLTTVVLSVFILLFEDYGRAEVGGIVLFLSLAFISWLNFIWIKNTKYLGFICALIIYGALWIYTPLLDLFFLALGKLLAYLKNIF